MEIDATPHYPSEARSHRTPRLCTTLTKGVVNTFHWAYKILANTLKHFYFLINISLVLAAFSLSQLLFIQVVMGILTL